MENKDNNEKIKSILLKDGYLEDADYFVRTMALYEKLELIYHKLCAGCYDDRCFRSPEDVSKLFADLWNYIFRYINRFYTLDDKDGKEAKIN